MQIPSQKSHLRSFPRLLKRLTSKIDWCSIKQQNDIKLQQQKYAVFLIPIKCCLRTFTQSPKLHLQAFNGWPSLVAQMVKPLPAIAEDLDSISVWGRSPGEGNGNPLQYSCLENSMDRGAWRATISFTFKINF